MSTRQQIGKRVRRLRKGRDQTLAELARLSGVSVSTISKIENDALSPTLDVILKLCDGLDVEIGDLVSEDDATQTDTAPNSRFSVARKDSGVLFDTPNYDYLYLCPDVKRKTDSGRWRLPRQFDGARLCQRQRAGRRGAVHLHRTQGAGRR